MRLDIRRGLTADRCNALAGLVKEMVADAATPADGPMLSAALLLSDRDVTGALDLPAPEAGEVLVQEYQGLDIRQPLPLDAPLAAEADIRREPPQAEYRLRIGPKDAPPAQELRLGLRLASAGELRDAREVRPRGAENPDWVRDVTIRGAAIARYCAISGDTNPLHTDPAVARSLGLPAPVVPGLLLLSLLAAGCPALSGDARANSLRARFVAPVYQDRTTTFALVRRGETRLRGFVLSGEAGAAVIADFETVA